MEPVLRTVRLLDVPNRWREFVDQWCLGVAPSEPPEQAHRALQAVARHLPEYMAALEAASSNGLMVVAQLFNTGRVLAATENLPGFGKVWDRAKRGESSAWAELEFASALQDQGHQMTLEPPVDGKVLDCSFEVGGVTALVEVICPEASVPFKRAVDSMHRISTQVAEACHGQWVSIVATQDPHANEQELTQAALALPPGGQTITTSNAIYRKAVFTDHAMCVSASDGDPTLRPTHVVGTSQLDSNGVLTRVEVEYPFTDARAHRLFDAELHHFSKQTFNVIAVKVNGVQARAREWAPLAARWFTPQHKTRIGAIVLWDSALRGQPMASRRSICVVPNPYAARPLPEGILNALRALDQAE